MLMMGPKYIFEMSFDFLSQGLYFLNSLCMKMFYIGFIGRFEWVLGGIFDHVKLIYL